ncbi:MAG: acyl-CoA dehydrogenase family protein, partial [Thermoplasmata archaeon]
MDFELTKEQELIARSVAEFADKEVAPKVAAYDEAEEFPRDLVDKMYDLGLMGMMVP